MPGLIDAHVHICCQGEVPDMSKPFRMPDAERWVLDAAYHMRLQLESGFTTVKDSFALNTASWELRRASEEGKLVGSRVIASGKCLTPTGEHGFEYGQDVAWGCDDLGDLRKAIRLQVHQGADFIKLVCSRRDPRGSMLSSLPAYTLDELRGAVEEAHLWGKIVSGHIVGNEATALAVRGGVDTLEHVSQVTDAVIDEMAEKRLIMVPTLAVMSWFHRLSREGKFLPPEALKEMPLEPMFDGVRRAHKRGVRIALGTDASNPGVLHGESAQEMELFVQQCGFTPMEAIVAGTRIAAEACARPDLGLVQPGKTADLLVFDGDPLADITALRAHKDKIQYVVKDGKVLVNRP
jgi:imidazolonepropionase-like amidohydrolase